MRSYALLGSFEQLPHELDLELGRWRRRAVDAFVVGDEFNTPPEYECQPLGVNRSIETLNMTPPGMSILCFGVCQKLTPIMLSLSKSFLKAFNYGGLLTTSLVPMWRLEGFPTSRL